MLDGFEILEFVQGTPSVSITKNGVSFNKSAVEKMRHTTFVTPLIDRDNKRFAIVPADDGDRMAQRYYNPDRKISYGVRWNNSDLLATFERMMGWRIDTQGYRIKGIFEESENALIFDLTQAEPIETKGGIDSESAQTSSFI